MTKPFASKVVVRCMSDGGFSRMHPAGFGARFGSGPYRSVEAAATAPMNLYAAQEALTPSTPAMALEKALMDERDAQEHVGTYRTDRLAKAALRSLLTVSTAYIVTAVSDSLEDQVWPGDFRKVIWAMLEELSGECDHLGCDNQSTEMDLNTGYESCAEHHPK